MKTKHLQKIFISSMYAMLIAVIFFLSPSGAQAQAPGVVTDCVIVPNPSDCCVNHAYLSEVSGCSGNWIIDMDGELNMRMSGGPLAPEEWYKNASVDTRLVNTITEIPGTDVVELRVYVLGPCVFLNTMQDILYRSDKMDPMLIAGVVIPIPLRGTAAAPIMFGPAACDLVVSGFSVGSCTAEVIDQDFGMYGHMNIQLAGFGGSATVVEVGVGEIYPLYRLYFKRKNISVPVLPEDFGFWSHSSGMIQNKIGLATYGGPSSLSASMIMRELNPGLPIQFIAMPNVFEYRFPSSVQTHDPIAFNSKTATLFGTFVQGDQSPSTALPEATTNVTGLNNLAAYNILTTTSASSTWDDVSEYGFLYTTATNPEIKMVPRFFSDSLDFVLEFLVTTSTGSETFDVSDLTAGLPLTVGTDIIYMVKSTGFTGDYDKKIDVIANEHYTYWSFSTNTYRSSETFLNIGEPKEFDAVDCMNSPIIVMDGDKCDDSPEPILRVDNHAYYLTLAGASDIFYDWYYLDGATEVHVQGPANDHTFDLTGQERGYYKVYVRLPKATPGTFCEADSIGYAEPCAGPFIVLQTSSAESATICNNGQITITVDAINTSPKDLNFVMDVFAEAGLVLESSFSTNSGLYTGTSWESDLVPSGDTVHLYLTYTGTNAGTTCLDLLHIAELVEVDGKAVVPPAEMVIDTFTVTVIPTPSVVGWGHGKYVYCSGSTSDPIVPDGVYTSFDYVYYMGTETIYGYDVTEVPSFDLVNTSGDLDQGLLALIPKYTCNGVTCTGTAVYSYISIYPVGIFTDVPTDLVYCDGETTPVVDFRIQNGWDGLNPMGWNNKYYWHRIGGFDFGLDTLYGVNVIPSFVAENKGNAPLVAVYEVTPYYYMPAWFTAYNLTLECPGVTETFLITVNPTPDIAPIADQTYCHGENVPAYNFTGDVADASYHWKKTSTTSMPGIPTEGYDIFPAFTAVNTGSTEIVLEYEVYAYYAFANGEAACSSDTIPFKITINPAPSLMGMSDLVYCSDVKVPRIDLFDFVEPHYMLGGKVKWEFVGGNTIGMAYLSGIDTIESWDVTNHTSTVVTALIKATPVFGACEGEPKYFTISVMPALEVNKPANMTVCHNTAIPDVHFSGTAVDAHYSWTATPTAAAIAIGMATSGNDFIPAFTTHNYADSIITVTVTVFPYMDINLVRCDSTSVTFTIAVAPEEVSVEPVDDMILCAGQVFHGPDDDEDDFGFEGYADVYYWEASSNAALIGLNALAGENSIGKFKTQNTTAAPIVVEIKVTPAMNNGGFYCYGSPIYFNIIVDPIPDVNPVADVEVCAGETINEVVLSGSIPGTTFMWVNDNMDIGLGSIGYGIIPSFTALNLTDTVIVANIDITPMFGSGDISTYCMPEDPYPVTITVYPKPVMDPVSSITVCDSADVKIPFTSSMKENVTYAWYVDNNGNAEAIGMKLTQTPTDTIKFLAENKTTNPITVLVTVTPMGTDDVGSCVGEPTTFSITVSPTGAMLAVQDQDICVGEMTAEVNFGALNAPIGTVFHWFNNTPGIGLPGEGVGNIPSFKVLTADTAIITVTAEYSNGSAFCNGDSTTFTITGYEIPVMEPVSSLTVCDSADVKIGFSSSMKAVTYSWYVDNEANAEAIGMDPVSATSDSIKFTATNTTANPITVWVTVTPSAIGTIAACVGESFTFSITVSPIGAMLAVQDQDICVGEMTAEINFGALNAPEGTVFHWFNDKPGIGLLGEGVGNIPSFKVLTADTATITVTAEYSNGSAFCNGDSITFTITGYEIPVMEPVSSLTVCMGKPVAIGFGSSMKAVTYNWYVDNEANATAIGMNPVSGPSDSIKFTATNNTANPITVWVTVTPSGVNAIDACTGESFTFSITVSPEPGMMDVFSQELCVGEMTAEIDFGSLNAPEGTKFHWWNDKISVGLPAEGEGNIPPFQIKSPGVATIKVTAEYDNASALCYGDTIEFTITSYEIPYMMPIINITACDGDLVHVPTWESSVEQTTYIWRLYGGADIGFSENYDSLVIWYVGQFHDFYAVNKGSVPLQAIFSVVPNSGAHCDGEEIFFTITVNPTPEVSNVVNHLYCHGTNVNAYTFTGNVIGANYYWEWTNYNDDEVMDQTMLPRDGYNQLPAYTAVNLGPDPITLEYMVTPSFEHDLTVCTGEPVTFTITIHPTPEVTPIADMTFCAGEATGHIWLNDGTASEYRWVQVSGDVITNAYYNLFEGGSDVIPSFTTVNAGNTVLEAVIKVTPYADTELCIGEPIYFSIFVNPTPNVEKPANQTLCAGERTDDIIFTGNAAGTIYRWTNVTSPATANMGLAAEGTGNILAFTTVNTTNAPIIATITVTPEFMEGADVCAGTPETFTITVNPVPVMDPVSDRIVCDGDLITIGFTSSMTTNVRYFWYVDNEANAHAIGWNWENAYGNINFAGVNNTTNPITVAVTVTPWSMNGNTKLCAGEPFTFNITVSPEPIILAVQDQKVCVGDMTAEVDFSALQAPAGTIFYWTNNNTTIGVEASGTGNIPPFAVTAAVTATFTISAEFPNGATPCVSLDTTFTITGYDRPVMDPIVDVIVCSGDTVVIPAFGSSVAGATYAWRFVDGVNIGLTPLQDNGNFPGFNAVNNGNVVISATYGVTGSNNGICEGEEIFFTIFVKPTPNVNTPADQTLCAGERTDDIIFTGDTENTIYRWTNDAVGMGLAASGVGNILAFTTENTTDAPIVATITVTPEFMMGEPEDACKGAAKTFTIIVNPVPVMVPVSSVTVCDSKEVDIEFESSMSANVEYRWYVDNEANAEAIGLVTGTPGNIKFNAKNETANPITVVVTVTPWSYTEITEMVENDEGEEEEVVVGTTDLCAGEPFTFSITVSPVADMYEIASQIVCVDDWTAEVDFSALNAPAGTVFHWTNNDASIGLVGEGNGNIPSFKVLKETVATITVYAEFSNGSAFCSGDSITFTITGYDRPVMTPIESITVCNGGTVTVPAFACSLDTANYTWRFVYGEDVGLNAEKLFGDDGIAPFTGTNDGTTVLTALYAVKATNNGYCESDEVFFSITVYPTPEADEPGDAIYCNGTQVPEHVFTGKVPGSTYEWFQTNANEVESPAEIPTEGYNVFPAFTAINLAENNEDIYLEYAVVPVFYENTDGTACTGDTVYFSITIHPTPEVVPLPDLYLCDGEYTGAINLEGGADKYYYMQTSGDLITGSLTDLFTGDEVKGTIPTFNVVNKGNTVLTAVIQVTPWTEDGYCSGTPIEFTIFVKPTPTVNTPDDQTLCAGERTDDIIFTGNTENTIYRWTVTTTGGADMGLAASGVGNILAFTTVNATNAPIKATITVTPEFMMGEPADACKGTAKTFYITVNPVPVMVPVSSVTVCDGTEVDIKFESSMTANVEYRWYVDNEDNAEAIGLDIEGTPGNIKFNAKNETANPITVVVTVTPWSMGGDDELCAGEAVTFSITVSPVATMYAIEDQNVCVGDMTAEVDFSALNAPAGTIFHWFVTNGVNIGLAPEGDGNIPSFEVTTDLKAIIGVTAQYNNASAFCNGDTIYFSITGRIRPTMFPIVNITVCGDGEEEVVVPDFMSNAIIPVYDWRFVDGDDLGYDLVGQGNMIPFTAYNPGTTQLMAMYAVKVSEAGFCESEEIFFTIVINPIPVADEVGDATYCSGTQVPEHVFTGNTPNATYHWFQWNYMEESIPELAQEGWDILPAFLAYNTTLYPIVLEYDVTPYYEYAGIACEGETVSFTITINPTPEVEPLNNLSFCAGEDTEPIEFTGYASEYRWIQISGDVITNDFSLFEGGVDVLPGFTTVNNGNVSLTAVIRVTPWSADGYCEGEAIEFTITVKPTPTVDKPSDQKLCSGESTSAINFTGDTQGTKFNWSYTTEPAGMNIGYDESGIGDIPSFVVHNFGVVPIVATFTVIPEFKSDPYDACEGEEVTFTITVNPIPEMDAIADVAYCSTTELTEAITLTGTVSYDYAEYRWVQVSGDVITSTLDLFAGGVNTIPAFVPKNTVSETLTAYIEVTPWTKDNLCHGATVSFSISIVPKPVVDMPQMANTEYCAGDPIAIQFTGNTPGIIYKWTNDKSGETGIGLPATGTSDILEFTAVNTTNAPIVATIVVTPQVQQGDLAPCLGDPITFTITVNPAPIMKPVSDMTYCINGPVDIPFLSFNMTENVQYDWYVDDVANAQAIGMTDLLTGNYGQGNILFTAANSTTHVIDVLVTVIPSSIDGDGNILCSGEAVTFTITVDPQPTIFTVANQEVCAGDMTAMITFNGSVSGTYYTWEVISDPYVNIGLPQTGIGNIDPFQAENTTSDPITITVQVTPKFGSGVVVCPGNPPSITFTITVNPKPVVTPLNDVTYCAGVMTNILPFTSTVDPNATYTWTKISGEDIGQGEEITGTGNFPNFETVNNGVEPMTATYKVVATVNGMCESVPVYFSITVNPTPHLDPVANKVYCSNWEIPVYQFTGTVEGAIYTWTFLEGDFIGLVPNSGTDIMPSFITKFNDTDHVLTAKYQVTVTYSHNGVPCGGEIQEFFISVVPNATVTNLQNVAVCHNDWVSIPAFEGVATTWEWAFDGGADVGVPGNNGEGQFPAFLAQNFGSNPIMATYKVTPYYEVEGIKCEGTPGVFTITVNPQPILNTIPEEMVYCNGTPVPAYNFSGTPNVKFRWERIGGDYIGIAANSGTGNLPQFTATNSTDDLLTGYFKAWAEITNTTDGTVCLSAEQTFSISVVPTAVIDVNSIPIVFCHNEEVPAIHFAGSIPGTSILNVRYEWNHIGGANIGTVMYGENTIPAFTAYNPGNEPVEAYFKVTPIVEYQGLSCYGTTYEFVMTVNPKAKLASVYDAGEVCSEGNFYYVAVASVENIDFTWVRPAIPGINDGEAGAGTGAIINETLTNTTDAPVVVEYHLTMSGNCTDPNEIFVVRVVVTPTPVMTSPADAGSICSGGTFDYVITSNVANTVYAWKRLSHPSINGGAVSAGAGQYIFERLDNNSDEAVTVTYEIALYHEGCVAHTKTYMVTITVEARAAIEIQPETPVCSNAAEAQIPYTTTQTLTYEYKIAFWRDALDQGFQDVLLFQELPSDYVPVTMPANVKPGQYIGTLIIRGRGCEVENEYQFILNVLQGTAIVGDLPDTPICLDNDLILSIDVIGEGPFTYTWYYGNNVIATTTTGIYVIPNATEANAGNYYVVVEGSCGSARSRIAAVGNLIVGQKWDDVLYVDNSKDLFHGYQWFRVIDGVKHAIDGATKQYYTEQPLRGTYMVEVYDALGNLMYESCEFTATNPAKNTITIYPNPVSEGGTLTIFMDMEREEVAGAHIVVYDMVGKQIALKVVDDQTTYVTMQVVPGAYVVRITSASGETLKSEKVIVR